MLRENLHISDEELLLMTDGELSARRSAQVRAHLATCWSCRSRMAGIEGTILDFAQAYRVLPGAELPSVAGPRALLSARLAELATESGASWRWFREFSGIVRVAAVCLGLFSVAFLGRLIFYGTAVRSAAPELPSLERGMVPDSRLTPGATRTTTFDDLCSAAHEEVVGQITAPLRNEVLREYGIAPAHAEEYEIDYLIAPGLGGTEDIHNLWPQSYTAQSWNAYAKDSLEERLHQLVCGGKLDLSVAQRDIASDWIAAYKKYFQTDRPLTSDAILAPFEQSRNFIPFRPRIAASSSWSSVMATSPRVAHSSSRIDPHVPRKRFLPPSSITLGASSTISPKEDLSIYISSKAARRHRTQQVRSPQGPSSVSTYQLHA